MAKVVALKDLYIEQLKGLYSSEILLIGVLPNMGRLALNPKLKAGFQRHLEQTCHQVERIEQILDDLNKNPAGYQCNAMIGLIKDSRKLIEEDAPPAVRDAALIATAQHIEHYEIAGYNCACTYALLLGDHRAADLLQTTLNEEIETEALLTEIAEKVNAEAASASLRHQG